MIVIYSATKQESQTFQNHYFELKIAEVPICYQNGHYNHFYCILQNFIFPIYS